MNKSRRRAVVGKLIRNNINEKTRLGWSSTSVTRPTAYKYACVCLATLADSAGNDKNKSGVCLCYGKLEATAGGPGLARRISLLQAAEWLLPWPAFDNGTCATGRRENCTKLMNTVVHRVSSITITNVHRRPWPATRWAFVVQRPVSRGVISFKNWGYELDLCSWFHLPAETTVWLIRFVAAFNPLMGTGNYSATSNNMMLVHWPLMGRLLH